MRYSGLVEHFNEKLQSLPNWDALARLVMGQGDAHFDGNEGSPRPETSDETEPAPDRVQGSNLTHRSPRPPKPSRADMVRGA